MKIYCFKAPGVFERHFKIFVLSQKGRSAVANGKSNLKDLKKKNAFLSGTRFTLKL